MCVCICKCVYMCVYMVYLIYNYYICVYIYFNIFHIYIYNYYKRPFPQTPARRGKDAQPLSPETPHPSPSSPGGPRRSLRQPRVSGVSPGKGRGIFPGEGGREAELFGTSPRPTFNPRRRCEVAGPEAAAYLSYLRPPRRWPHSAGDPRGRPPSSRPSSSSPAPTTLRPPTLLAPSLPWDPALPVPAAVRPAMREGDGPLVVCPSPPPRQPDGFPAHFAFLLPRSNTHYSC